MLIWFFLIGIVFACVLLYIGLTQNSFPMAYMAMFAFLVLGLFLFQSGLEVTSGSTYTDNGTNIIATDTYTTYMPQQEIVLSLIGNFFIYGSVVGLIMTTFLAFRS